MLSPKALARKNSSLVKNSGPEHSTFTSVSPEGGVAASAAFFLLLQAVIPPDSISAVIRTVMVRFVVKVFIVSDVLVRLRGGLFQ